MKINKIKLKIGYLLMLIGIFLPLASLTKIAYTDFCSESSYKNFFYNNKDDTEKVESEIEDYNHKVKEKNEKYLIDPFINDKYNAEYDIYRKNPNMIFAYILIPKINVKMPIRLGASAKNLDRGAAHLDETSLPTGGIGTRSVIAGHRGWYKGNMFLHVNKLKKGDKVYIERNKKRLEYEVVNKEIVMPNDWDKLEPEEEKDILTLLTCDPVITRNPKRLLINCENTDKNFYERKNKNKYNINFTEENKTFKNETLKSVLFMKYILYFLVIVGWVIEIYILNKFIKVKNMN